MKHSTITHIAIKFFKQMGVALLWYLGIFAVAVAILQIIFMLTGVDTSTLIKANESGFTPFLTYTFTEIFAHSQRVYLLVLGITYPLLFLRYYLEAGVTRRQFALGLSVAAIALSLCFSAIYTGITLFIGIFSPSSMLSGIAHSVIYFFIGWLGVIGFQLQRVYTAALGIICANALLWGTIALTKLSILEWIKPLIVLVAAGLVMAVLLKTFSRIAVRC
jgi:hypothetical protein